MFSKITYLLFAVVICFTSCSKQDPSSELSNVYDTSYLEGTYRLAVLEVTKPSNLDDKEDGAYNLVEEMSCFDPTIDLQEDGQVAYRGTELNTGTDARKGIFTFECGEDRETFGKWKFRNHQIILGTAEFRVEGSQLVYEAQSDSEIYRRIVYVKA